MNKSYLYGLCLTTAIITGCSSTPRTQHHNLPTQIDIVALDLQNMQWKLRIKHRHRDTKTGNQLSCTMDFDDRQLSFRPQPLPDLTINATETITVQKIDTNLPGLSNKVQPSIDYQLSCQLSSDNFDTETITKKSVLYQVPGEQGLYR